MNTTTNNDVEYTAYKFRLAPTPDQQQVFRQAVGQSRFAYNLYVRHFLATQKRWIAHRQSYLDTGHSPEVAREKTVEDTRALTPNDHPPITPAIRHLGSYGFQREVLTPLRLAHKLAALQHCTLSEITQPSEDICPAEKWEHLNRARALYPECFPADSTPWLHEKTVNRRYFIDGIDRASTAVNNYFASLTRRRSGPAMGKPRFHKRGLRDSVTIPILQGRHSIGAYGARPKGRSSSPISSYHHVALGSLGRARSYNSTKKMCRQLSRDGAKIRSITLSRTAGYWYVSFMVASPLPDKPPRIARRFQDNGAIGIDWGVTHFVAMTNGTIVTEPTINPKLHKKLVGLQRKLSRQEKGSKRREHTKQRIARIHHLIALQRTSFLHALTKQITTQHTAVAIEDLNIKGMTTSARGTVDNPGAGVKAKAGFNRKALNSAPSEFFRQLEYKAERYGSELIKIGRFVPSSQLCSHCGYRHRSLTLSDRTFPCPSCGITLDRDINAARNILRIGLEQNNQPLK